MNMKTRLYAALMLSALVLVLNMLAVVEGVYQLPESDIVEIALQGDCYGTQNYTFTVVTSSSMQAMNLPDSRSGNGVITGMTGYSC